MGTKERILEETARMFFRDGIKSIRMDDIASSCGISKRTLYENFSDREDLIRQCLWYFFEKRITEMNEKLFGTSNVIEEFWVIFDIGTESRGATKMVIRDLMKFYPDIFSDFVKTRHKWVIEDNRKRFERGQEQGLILKNIDTEFLSRNLADYLYGLNKAFEDAETENTDLRLIERPRSIQFIIMLYLRGMATEKGRKYIDETILEGLE